MASSSSTHKPNHLLNHLYGGGPTSAPPPTPSSQQQQPSNSDATAADTLSRLLHRLPPNLSLPTRLSPRSTSTSTTSPLPKLSLSSTSSSSFEVGYFQVSDDDELHLITPEVAESAESEALALFELTVEDKLASFPRDWPVGFNDDDDDHQTGSFCLDGSALASTTSKSSLVNLTELTHKLEELGLKVVERLAKMVGFENPFKEGQTGPKHSSLLWISSSSSTSDGEKARKMYPYAVGMQYQIRPMKWELLSDSGSVNVEPKVGSVLVTLGDITQVWSNGKLKKVRGRPTPVLSKDNGKPCVSMTLLLTLPLESTVSPLLIDHKNREIQACKPQKDHKNDDDIIQSFIEASTSNDDDNNDETEDQKVFNSFSFEDYAWRVYHDRLHTKDPLDRYRAIK